jgi:DNA invertase Pin-like site-specific DNA recombinase
VPTNLLVCHNCPGGDNPRCFNPDHLWLGEPVQNTQDMIAKGGGQIGERHHGAILTAENVVEIRELSQAHVRQADIAARFGVSTHTVKRVVARRVWKHVA